MLQILPSDQTLGRIKCALKSTLCVLIDPDHQRSSWIPEIPTLVSLGVIVGILALATTTSVIANRREARRELAATDAGESEVSDAERDRAEV